MVRLSRIAITLVIGIFAQWAPALARAAEGNLPSDEIAFTSFEYRGENPNPPAPGQYCNPILPGFHPDPSICRVGDDFYLVNSTFAYYPGVPIFHSTDLVNWQQIGNVLSRPSQLQLDGANVSGGIYAPTLRYHDGTFYLITTNISSIGNFYVTAKNPAGPWSNPIQLKDIDGIDPSFFFDDDGKAYVVHNGNPPDKKPLYSGHRALWLFEFDLAAGKVRKETGRIIVNGGSDFSKHPVWIEGPHLYKRNGYYYLAAAEGGTGDQHSEVIFRSKSIWGPYESWSGNPILTQRGLPGDRPHPITCVGHCDFVQTPAGQWYAVCLGSRPYKGDGSETNLGRETFLLPMDWSGEWPVISKPGEVLPAVFPKPDLPAMAEPSVGQIAHFVWRDDFSEPALRWPWLMLRTPRKDWYSLSELPGALLMKPQHAALYSDENPSYLGLRQQHAQFSASITEQAGANCNADAGLVAFQSSRHYLFLGVQYKAGAAEKVFLERCAQPEDENHGGRVQSGGSPTIVASQTLQSGRDPIELKIEGSGRWYSFSWRAPEGKWTALADHTDGSILSTAVAGGFVGCTVGPMARSAGD